MSVSKKGGASAEPRGIPALELFNERSFSQVSMRELAAHVGISLGAINHRIESKETMLFELLMELYQALLSQVERAEKRKLSPAQRLTTLIEYSYIQTWILSRIF